MKIKKLIPRAASGFTLTRWLAIALATTSALAIGSGVAQAQRPLGIDVSSYQGAPNWTSIHGAGVVFAYAKATEGTTINDADFVYNQNNGKAAGVYMGAYHFAHPNSATPAAEASHFWSVAHPYVLADGKSLSPTLDFEVFSGVDGASSYSDWANQFLNTIVSDAAGQNVVVHPVIYVSSCNACDFNSSVSGWNAWLANYNGQNIYSGTPWSVCTSCEVWGAGVWDMWQGSDSGSIAGISGSVDLDTFNGNTGALVSALVATSTTPPQRIDVFAEGNPSGSGVDEITWQAGTGWSGWANLGTVGTGKPAVCSYATGYLNVFVRGTNNALWTKYYSPGGGWSTWQSLGGNMTSDPCCVAWRGSPNIINIFYQGTNNQIVQRYWQSTSGWNSGEINQGGTPIAGGAPAACSYQYGYLNLFIRGTDNSLWTTYFAPGGWQGSWSTLGGVLTSDPGTTSWGANRIDVFAQGSPAGSGVDHISWIPGGWSSWENLGSSGTNAPAVCSYTTSYLNVYTRGSDNALWTKYYYPAGGWSTWQSLGGVLTSAPGCVSWTTGH